LKGNQVRLLVNVSSLALAAIVPSIAVAQTAPADQTAPVSQDSAATAPLTAQASQSGQLAPPEKDVVITGVRQSLSSAQAIKRNSNEIVDSVQAQDIGKLPDANTVEALQRITGVQIQRRYGEGDTDFDHRTQPAITVRGLTQVSNFIDGRQALSAAGSRSLDLQAVPPELLAGIDVFKNPPASTIEGDIAGVVNIRTRLPFDSPGQLISATAKANYYDRAQKVGGSGSALYSNRFDTGIGEMGILLNASYGKSSYRQDAILIGAFGPIPAGIDIPGAPANAQVPFGEQIYDDGGDRKRLASPARGNGRRRTMCWSRRRRSFRGTSSSVRANIIITTTMATSSRRRSQVRPSRGTMRATPRQDRLRTRSSNPRASIRI